MLPPRIGVAREACSAQAVALVLVALCVACATPDRRCAVAQFSEVYWCMCRGEPLPPDVCVRSANCCPCSDSCCVFAIGGDGGRRAVPRLDRGQVTANEEKSDDGCR